MPYKSRHSTGDIQKIKELLGNLYLIGYRFKCERRSEGLLEALGLSPPTSLLLISIFNSTTKRDSGITDLTLM